MVCRLKISGAQIVMLFISVRKFTEIKGLETVPFQIFLESYRENKMCIRDSMYIRIASNDFFSVSKDVVSKMISGEYDAEPVSYTHLDVYKRQPIYFPCLVLST